MKKEHLNVAVFVFLGATIITVGAIVGYKGARQKVEMRAEEENFSDSLPEELRKSSYFLQKIKIAVLISEDGELVSDMSKFYKYWHLFLPEEEENTVSNYYKTVSYGNLQIDFDIFNTKMSGVTINPNGCQYRAPTLEERSAFGYYYAYIFINVSDRECNKGIHLAGTIQTDGVLAGKLSTYLHEIGHTLLGQGMHARIESCPDCVEPFDMMTPAVVDTNTNVADFNAYFKQRLNWGIMSQIVSTKDINIDCPGKDFCDYPIAPLEKNPDGVTPQLLKVDSLDSDYYYLLEYRQPVGYDADTPLKNLIKDKGYGSEIFGGLLLRKVHKYLPYDTFLINPKGPQESYDDAYFRDDMAYSKDGVTITQKNNYAEQATVRIQFER